MPETFPLAALLDVIIDHRGKTPRKLGGDFTESGIPVVSAIHIKDGRIKWDERARFVSPEMYRRWMPVTLSVGDVLLTSEAPLGEVAAVPTNEPLVLSQRLFALRGRRDVLDNDYLRYFLTSRDGQAQLAGRSTGTTVTGIRQSQLLQLEIPVPPLDDQRRIVEVLGALDGLIDADHGLLRGLLQLPVAYVEMLSETRDSVPLGDLYEVGLSGVWGEDARDSKSSVEVAVLRGKDIENFISGSVITPPIRYLSPKQVASRTPAEGEIWTAGSGSLGPSMPISPEVRATIGHETVLYSNFVKRLVPTTESSRYGSAWVGMFKAWRDGAFQAFRTGTAMPNLDPGAMLRGVNVSLLTESETQMVNALVEQAMNPELRDEIRQLRRARDELLPLLMSGRVTPGELGS